MTWKRMRVLGIVLLVVGLAGLQAAPAHAAATIAVTTCDESHLDAAVTQANNDNAGDTITFGCSGTITLTSALFITGAMTINGIGQTVVIDGGSSVELIDSVAPTLGLENLTLSHGSNTFAGGVYDNGGTLNVDTVTFSNNTATGGSGGAVYVRGTAHISNTTFSGNAAQNGATGGALENAGGQVTIASGSFSNNTAVYGGGAINNEAGGTLNISNGTTFSDNSASGDPQGYGGAIYNTGGTVTVTHGTFSSNSAPSGGAIDNTDTVNVTSSSFDGNSASDVLNGYGGAIGAEGPVNVSGSSFTDNSARTGGAIESTRSTAPVQISDSTFSYNTAGSATASGNAGAILDAGSVTISRSLFLGNTANAAGGAIQSMASSSLSIGNSTFSGNSGAQAGGALFAFSSASVTNSTFSGNAATGQFGSGGAVYTAGGTLSVAGSILSGNSPNNCHTNNGSLADNGYNLESASDCSFTATGSLQNTDPLLVSGGPQDNGGPTYTIALQSGSPAADRIPVGSGPCPATDQRGFTRPDASGTETNCDVGAYELDASAPTGTTLSQVSGTATYGGGATVTATLRDAASALVGGQKITFALGGIPVCDVPGQPSCPQTGTSGASLGVATLSGVAVPSAVQNAHTYPGDVHASFVGAIASSPGGTGYAGSTGTGDLMIGKAGSSTSAVASAGAITVGQSFTVNYEVSSASGIFGSNATGRVSLVQDSGPGAIQCTPSSVGISASENNADGTGAWNAGFDFVVNNTTNSADELSCTSGTAGSYTFHVHFNDTDGNYNASDSGTLSVTVNQPVATAISAVSGDATYGGTANFTATLQDAGSNGVSGKTITFALWTGVWTPICGGTTGLTCPTTGGGGVATLSGVTLPAAYANAGTYSGDIQASFAGDGSYIAGDADGTLTVSPSSQSITFGALANKTYGDPDFGVSATASSGLTVNFSASGNCTVAGSTVRLTGAGSCTITASQSGNSDYSAAPSVQQSFAIAQASTGTLLVSSTNPALVGQSVTFTATISPAPDGGTVAFRDGGASIGCNTQPITSGHATCMATFSSAGSHNITATYSGDTNYAGSATTSALSQVVGYTVHTVSTRSLTIVLQLWNASNADVSSSSLTVTAECVVRSTTVPASCGTSPAQTINQPFRFEAAGKRAGAQYSYQLNSSGLTRKVPYYLLIQADGDPTWHAIQFIV